MTRDWFYMDDDQPRSLDDLYDLYSQCRQKGVNLLLNVGPDKRGKIPQDRIERLMELKEAIISGP